MTRSTELKLIIEAARQARLCARAWRAHGMIAEHKDAACWAMFAAWERSLPPALFEQVGRDDLTQRWWIAWNRELRGTHLRGTHLSGAKSEAEK